jgi:hypothetical protein
MSKRKREIQKRKKLAEDVSGDQNVQAAEQAADAGAAVDPEHDFTAAGDLAPGPPVDDSQIVAAPRQASGKKKTSTGKKPPVPAAGEAAITDSWLGKNKENLLLAILVLYVLLLGLGTVGELFEIEWILNLPLFR